jgi:MoaA/NifB/PqqE/SkfB family radical SAM enzyme
MYFIELLITKRCNQECYYCTTQSSGSVQVDIDYLKWVLDQFPNETGVELTGGEVGLVQNIDKVYRTIHDHPSIKHIMVMSNGLLRHCGVDWINDVEYWEHLIYEIKDKKIIKFYPDLDLEQKHRYVIVTTELTTKSLIENWEYFEDMGMFRDNFFYKLMNHKSILSINKYFDYLIELYLKIDNVYFQRMLLHYYLNTKKSTYLKERKLRCQKYSPNPFVDLQTKQLGHCAINIQQSNKVDFSKENLKKLMNGELSENSYCEKCYSFDNGKNRSATNNRSYIQ